MGFLSGMKLSIKGVPSDRSIARAAAKTCAAQAAEPVLSSVEQRVAKSQCAQRLSDL
jgi:enoyl-[acyl-carrier-protein] reductase (NADH)